MKGVELRNKISKTEVKHGLVWLVQFHKKKSHRCILPISKIK